MHKQARGASAQLHRSNCRSTSNRSWRDGRLAGVLAIPSVSSFTLQTGIQAPGEGGTCPSL